jgi:hypothetical protein
MGEGGRGRGVSPPPGPPVASDTRTLGGEPLPRHLRSANGSTYFQTLEYNYSLFSLCQSKQSLARLFESLGQPARDTREALPGWWRRWGGRWGILRATSAHVGPITAQHGPCWLWQQ